VKYHLEKGSRKFICPSCRQKTFVRYLDERGYYAGENGGRCDREKKCGLHCRPHDSLVLDSATARLSHDRSDPSLTTGPDFINADKVSETLCNYEENNFVQFLLNLFPNWPGMVWQIIDRYKVGTVLHPQVAYTCFPYYDVNGVCRRAKLMRYDRSTGKRRKTGRTNESSLESHLRLTNYRHRFNFFGEHLLRQYPSATVCVVEAEKTAIVASIGLEISPEDVIWLGSFNASALTSDRLVAVLAGRTVRLFPDGDNFDAWTFIADEAANTGLSISVSSLIERCGTQVEKKNGFDFADYIIAAQQRENEQYGWTEEEIRIVRAEQEAIRCDGHITHGIHPR
jgi:hypothetical protein